MGAEKVRESGLPLDSWEGREYLEEPRLKEEAVSRAGLEGKKRRLGLENV